MPYTPNDAWAAFEAQHYDLAAQIWLALLVTARDAATLARFQLGYSCVLLAQRQYQEAGALFEEIYDSTADAICLHQLGQLARTKGQLDTAKAHFMAERLSLKPEDSLALALNAYALGDIAFQQGHIEAAFHYAHLSLDHARKAGNPLALGHCYQLMGRIREALREAEKAQDCYEAAEAAWETLAPHYLQSDTDIRLVACFLALKQSRAARDQHLNSWVTQPQAPFQSLAQRLQPEAKSLGA